MTAEAFALTLAAGVAVVFVGLWVGSVIQARRFGRQVDGVLARLAGGKAAAPAASVGAPLWDATVMVSRIQPPADTSPKPFPRVVPPASQPLGLPHSPAALTTGDQRRQITAISGHHNATKDTQMSISPFTEAEATTAGISLRWSLYQLTQHTEQFGRELAASPHAAVIAPDRARRALAHLAAGIAELDGVAADLDAAMGPGRGGAR